MSQTTWTDQDIIAYKTLVKDVHIEEMRTAINNLEKASSVYYTATQTGNTYTITDTSRTSYGVGDHFYIKIPAANTSSVSIQYNSLATKSLLKYITEALVANDLVTGQIVEVVFDGTNFLWVNAPAPATASLPTGTNTGTVDAVVTSISGVTSYTSGLTVSFVASGPNTGAATINVSGCGVVSIKRPNGTDVLAGDIVTGTNTLVYNGSYFIPKSLLSTASADVLYTTASGTANAATVVIPGISAYAVGLPVVFKASAANTGAMTVNINGLGAKSVVKQGATALTSGDIVSGQLVFAVYDGTNFQLVGGSTPDLSGYAVLSVGSSTPGSPVTNMLWVDTSA